MLTKILLVIILLLIVTGVILFILYKIQKNKTKKLSDENEKLENAYVLLEKRLKLTTEELEIEKKYKNELAKKLSDINSMSIDDVLAQLQNG